MRVTMDSSSHDERRRRILAVDDEVFVLQVTETILSDLGYEVQTASSGTAALRRIDACDGAFDLVIIDHRLTDRSGVEVIEDCRAKYPALPFMLVTGYASYDVVEEASRAGVNKVLEKPYDWNTLADAVRDVLAQS